MYVDGLQTGAPSNFSTLASSSGGSLWIGGGSSPSVSAQGLIDDVRIYRRALNQTEARWSTGHRMLEYSHCDPQMDTGSGWRDSDPIPTTWRQSRRRWVLRHRRQAPGRHLHRRDPQREAVRDGGATIQEFPIWDSKATTAPRVHSVRPGCGSHRCGTTPAYRNELEDGQRDTITLTRTPGHTPLYIQYSARERPHRAGPEDGHGGHRHGDARRRAGRDRIDRTLMSARTELDVVNRFGYGKMAENFLGDTWYWWQNHLDDEHRGRVPRRTSRTRSTTTRIKRIESVPFKFGSHLLVADRPTRTSAIAGTGCPATQAQCRCHPLSTASRSVCRSRGQ